MEHVLLQSTNALADGLGVAVPDNARQDSLKRRLAAFREVAGQIKNEKLKTKLLKLADRIANANGFRQRLTHGIWDYEVADPDILHLQVSRYMADGPEEFLNTEKIYKFAAMVSEISFELAYPAGLTQKEYADLRGSEPFFSREFLRTITSKKIASR